MKKNILQILLFFIILNFMNANILPVPAGGALVPDFSFDDAKLYLPKTAEEASDSVTAEFPLVVYATKNNVEQTFLQARLNAGNAVAIVNYDSEDTEKSLSKKTVVVIKKLCTESKTYKIKTENVKVLCDSEKMCKMLLKEARKNKLSISAELSYRQ